MNKHKVLCGIGALLLFGSAATSTEAVVSRPVAVTVILNIKYDPSVSEADRLKFDELSRQCSAETHRVMQANMDEDFAQGAQTAWLIDDLGTGRAYQVSDVNYAKIEIAKCLDNGSHPDPALQRIFRASFPVRK